MRGKGREIHSVLLLSPLAPHLSPLKTGCWSNLVRHLVCTQEIGVQLPGGPLVLTTGYGLLTNSVVPMV